jgi:hypothetical protein
VRRGELGIALELVLAWTFAGGGNDDGCCWC